MEPNVVAAFICFDLGGRVKDWNELQTALKGTCFTAKRWEAGDAALQTVYRATHGPVMLLEDHAPQTLLMGDGREWPATRTIKIYPTGVLSFRYEVDAGRASVCDLFAIKEYFRKSDKGGLATYLREAYPGEAERNPSTGSFDYGIDIVNDMLLIRMAAQKKDVLAFRPRQAFGLLSRYALCVSPRPTDRLELEAQLRELARAKGLVYPDEDLWELPRGAEQSAARLRALPGAIMASWEGFETYIATDDVRPRTTALDAMELMHQFSFLCRAWIEILDRVEPFGEVKDKLGVKDLREIENRSLRLSRLQHEITQALVEIDSGDVMIIDPVRLQYVSELRERFFLERAQRMVYDRLDALDRRMAVMRDVLERAYQEGSRRQGQTLQLLFAGAVAAALTALIPAVAAPHRSGLQWTVGVATAASWIVLIVLIITVKLKIEVTLQPPDEPDWIGKQPKPRSVGAPDRTHGVGPDTDRGPLQR